MTTAGRGLSPGVRVAIYITTTLVVLGAGLATYYVYFDESRPWAAQAVDAQCAVFAYSFTRVVCDSICFRGTIDVRYANRTGGIVAWHGSTVSEGKETLGVEYPIGCVIYCVYSASDPSDVRLRRPGASYPAMALIVAVTVATACISFLLGETYCGRSCKPRSDNPTLQVE